MKAMTKFALVSLVATLSGCAGVVSPTTGVLFTSVQGPVTTGTATDAARTGQSCAINVLGAIAIGDASIDAAKRAGNIKNVASVDTDSMNALGLFARFCTIVKGN